MGYFSNFVNLKKLIDKNQVISFDVFDTLLFRAVKEPVDVFSFMEMLDPPLFESFGGGFKHVRMRAEALARKRVMNGEASLEDIYSYILYVHPLSSQVIEKIKQVELKAERMLLYANPLALNLFNYAVEQNKKIIICSDMYLPSAFICELLSANHFDLNRISKCYVSNEYRKNKYSGSLFAHILSENNINPEKMLHIGDNYHSDVKKAKKYKINAYYLAYPSELLLTDLPVDSTDSITASLMAGLQLKFLLKHDNFSLIKKWSVNKVAFFHLAYFLYLVKKLSESSVKKVLFFSRDSYIYYRLLEKCKNKFNFNKAYSYFYVSRKSVQNEILFSQYIQQECGGFDEVALVDLGWHGVIHSKIEQLSAQLEQKTTFYGFYVNLMLTESTSNIKQFNSFLIDFPRKDHYFTLLEIFHIAPHPTTLHYEKKDNRLLPVFEVPLKAEQGMMDSGMAFQEESFEFISMITAVLPAPILFSLDLKLLTRPFFDMVVSPSFLDIRHLGDLTVSTASGATDTGRKKVSPKVFMGFLGNINPLYRKAKRSLVWKEGTRKRNFTLSLKRKV